MSLFWIGAAALCLVALAFVVVPLLRGTAHTAARDEARREANVGVYRERLAELESARDNGDIGEPEYQALKDELERDLLQDTADAAPVVRSLAGRRWLWAAAGILPLGAVLLYTELGAARDWPLADQIVAYNSGELSESSQLASLTAAVSRRLAAEPDHDHYRFLHARLAMDQGRFRVARDDFERLLDDFPDDAELWAHYTQAAYLAAGQQLTDRVSRAAQRTLQLEPGQRAVLGLLGMHHYRNGEFGAAADYWQRLLQILGPRSPDTELLRRAIASARAQQAPAERPPEVGEGEAQGAALDVTVQVDPALRERLPKGTLFVFAKAVEGPPMPLAVARLQPGEWPVRVQLDDAMAMAPGLRLSGFEKVQVTARISRGGSVSAAAGDAEGSSGVIDLGAGLQPVNVTIDSILP